MGKPYRTPINHIDTIIIIKSKKYIHYLPVLNPYNCPARCNIYFDMNLAFGVTDSPEDKT